MQDVKLDSVKSYWNEESCGERYADGVDDKAYYLSESKSRYELEPYILTFADFEHYKDLDVLEIGVGMGSDHSMIAKSCPKSLTGVDLTERAIEHTKKRFTALNLTSNLKTDNAQSLSFDDESFDSVYSWGVLHHSPETEKCFDEVHRVLRHGGEAKIMIYHTNSPTGWMLWLKYGLFKLNLSMSFSDAYSLYLESPGTKAYTVKEAMALAKNFSEVSCEVVLCHGDLLEGDVGKRHKGFALSIAKAIFPKKLMHFLSKKFPFGLFLMMTLKK